MTRSAHIPPGREGLWRRQAAANAEVDRLSAEVDAAAKYRDDLVAALGWDDPLVDEADEEMARHLDAHNRAVAVADRVYQERTAGLSSWIDHDPTAPVCGTCHGAGGPPGCDARGACPNCRGWGREHRAPIPVWSDRDQGWIDPATGRAVDLLADPQPPGQETDMPRHEAEEEAKRQRYDVDHNGAWTTDGRATEAEREAERRFWDADSRGDGQARDAAYADWQAAQAGRREAEAVEGERKWKRWEAASASAPPLTEDELARIRDLGGDGLDREHQALMDRRRAAVGRDDIEEAARLDVHLLAVEDERRRRAEDKPVGRPTSKPREGKPAWADRERYPHETRPSAASTNGSAGGNVASIEEVRAGIAAANEKANEALGALTQAHADLEQAQGTLMRATEGSGQADVSQANGMLAQAVADIEVLRQQVSGAISSAEDVGNRL